MDIDKNIASVLGVNSTPKKQEVEIIPPIKSTQVSTSTPVPNVAEEDFEFVRATLRGLILKSNSKLDEMDVVSKTLETPRSYEVYSIMMEKMSGLTKDLYDLHKKKKDLEENNTDVTPASVTVDKAVFVGTTAELLTQIKEAKKHGS